MIEEIMARIAGHPPTSECADAECMVCGARDCPHGEPLHYHHDGCPACYEKKSTCKNCGEAVKLQEYKGALLIKSIGYYVHDDGDIYCGDVTKTPAAKCHICGTTTDEHGQFCSAAGAPKHRAEV